MTTHVLSTHWKTAGGHDATFLSHHQHTLTYLVSLWQSPSFCHGSCAAKAQAFFYFLHGNTELNLCLKFLCRSVGSHDRRACPSIRDREAYHPCYYTHLRHLVLVSCMRCFYNIYPLPSVSQFVVNHPIQSEIKFMLMGSKKSRG